MLTNSCTAARLMLHILSAIAWMPHHAPQHVIRTGQPLKHRMERREVLLQGDYRNPSHQFFKHNYSHLTCFISSFPFA